MRPGRDRPGLGLSWALLLVSADDRTLPLERRDGFSLSSLSIDEAPYRVLWRPTIWSFVDGSARVRPTETPRDRQLVNQWASDHCRTLAGGTPILALDIYDTPITWTTAPKRPPMSTRSWRSSAGATSTGCSVR